MRVRRPHVHARRRGRRPRQALPDKTGREFPVFLAQVLLQPLFLLFVFGKVLTTIGAARAGYADLLFPGIIALTTMLTALQGTALPLVLDFSLSREIEDRLLAPLPVMAVAVEKMLFAMLRAVVAAAVMFPLGYWILGGLSIRASGVPLLVFAIVIGSLLGAVPHMHPAVTVPVMLACTALFIATGMRGFRRRTLP